MNILDSELVLKYFGSDMLSGDLTDGQLNILSRRVLRAMQEPISKGERILRLISLGNKPYELAEIVEDKAVVDYCDLHPFYLRLPDRFQAAGKKICAHDGLKRYCDNDVYCENCKRGINEEWARAGMSFDRKFCKCCPCHHDTTCPHYQPSPAPEKMPYCSDCGKDIPDSITAKVHVAIHDISIKDKPADSEKCYAGCEKGTCPFLRSSGSDKVVEEVITDLCKNYKRMDDMHFAYRLRELVSLARGSK